MDVIEREGYERLAAAIVRQAVDDYRSVCRGVPINSVDRYVYEGGVRRTISKREYDEKRRQSCERSKKEIESFFRSDHFKKICDLDGEMILQQLKYRRRLDLMKIIKA